MTTEYRSLAPGVQDRTSDAPVTDTNLQTVRMNHACFHITNPDRSLAFYKKVLGYSTLFTWNIGPQTVFFLGHKQQGQSQEDFLRNMQRTQGLLELLWLHDDEPSDKTAVPKSHERPGFFHIGFTVDDVSDIVERAEKFGGKCIKPVGKPTSLTQLGLPANCSPLYEECPGPLGKIAFIADPDGNWIELIPTIMVSNSKQET